MKRISVLFVFLIFWLCGCSVNDTIGGGGGSETINRIEVCVSGSLVSGKVAPFADVQLYPEKFTPVTKRLPDSLRTKADSKGFFVFNHKLQGIYNFYTVYDSAGEHTRSAMIQYINVLSDKDTTFAGWYNVPVVLVCSFKIDSTISGDTSLTKKLSGWTFIYGSPFSSLQNNFLGTSVIVGLVPPGNYDFDIWFSASAGPFNPDPEIKIYKPDIVIVEKNNVSENTEKRIVVSIESNK